MDALILSYALDTNGQNHRFVQAARKHGDTVLNALAIGTADPAGVVGRMAKAAEKGDALRIQSIQSELNYLNFEHQNVWWRHRVRPEPCPQHGTSCYLKDAEILTIAEAADVIHLNNSEIAYRRLRLRKPALLHHHGSLFRGDPARMLNTAKHYRMEQCVSTIDLQRPAPDLLTWLPTAYNIAELQKRGKKGKRPPDGRIRIVHAPTNRQFKHTALFLEAIRQLQEEGLPIDVDLVEGVTWAECMERKAQADIVFDQLAFGYGCNAVEAWGMGIPVIAGADAWTLDRMANQWNALPFEEATDATLKDVIRSLVESADLREDAGQRGYAHVRKYHDEKPALAKLAELYEKAIKRYSRQRIPGKGPAVTFRKTSNAKVYFDDEPIPFVHGTLTTDDPHVINRLRTLAKRPLRFGIEEVA